MDRLTHMSEAAVRACQQRLRAMALVFKLALFYITRLDWFPFCQGFQSLHTGLFIERDCSDVLFGTFKGLLIGVADIRTVNLKRFISGRVYPSFDFIGTNISLILKNAPLVSARWMERYLYPQRPLPANSPTSGSGGSHALPVYRKT